MHHDPEQLLALGFQGVHRITAVCWSIHSSHGHDTVITTNKGPRLCTAIVSLNITKSQTTFRTLRLSSTNHHPPCTVLRPSTPSRPSSRYDYSNFTGDGGKRASVHAKHLQYQRSATRTLAAWARHTGYNVLAANIESANDSPAQTEFNPTISPPTTPW